MTVSWSFGGTQFSSFGVVRVMDDYLDMPERRGENVVLPFRHGTVFEPKYYDERKITFGLYVQTNSATDQDDTFDTIRKLFGRRTQQTLSCTREDGSVRTAQATVDSILQAERIISTFANIVLEFTLAEPFFRAAAQSTDTATISTTDTALTATNNGTVEERAPTITLTGPLANVTISTTDSISMTYTGALASTDTIVIGVLDGEYYATLNGVSSVIGNVTHTGSSALLVLQPGTNNLSVTCTTTGGTVKLNYYAPYF